MFHSNPLPVGSFLILGRRGSVSRPLVSTLWLTSPLRIQQVELCHPSRAWFKMRRFRNYAFLRIHFTPKLRLIGWSVLVNFCCCTFLWKRLLLAITFRYNVRFNNRIFWCTTTCISDLRTQKKYLSRAIFHSISLKIVCNNTKVLCSRNIDCALF